MKIPLLSLLLTFCVVCAFSQSNSTEIFLVNLIGKGEKMSCSTPVNITNHEGYDNQPEFSRDGKRILYVSMPDTLQTDVFEYTIADSSTRQLTNSPESEYSPKFSPLSNLISIVRVDGDKGQRFYQSNEDFNEVYDMIGGLDSIGYYCWLNDSTVALACLNNGLDLYIYELNSGQYVVIEKGIGRCLMKIPGTEDLVYTRKTADRISLFRYAAVDNSTSLFCSGLDTTEDYSFTPDGKLLAGQNGKLFVCNPGMDSKWMELADFTKSAGTFYRLAVSPEGNRLALVTYKGKRP